MIQTRGELIEDFLDFVGHAGDDGARDTVERMLNRALETIAGKRPWRALQSPIAYEFDTVANARSYGMPPWFGHVSGVDGKIRNLTTGDQIIPGLKEQIEERYPNIGTTFETANPPKVYYFAGTQPVPIQPVAIVGFTGDDLSVRSDNAGDITVRVAVAGIRFDVAVPGANPLEYARVEVTLNGPNPVALGTWTHLDEFSKSYPDGVVPPTELTSSAGRVTLNGVFSGDFANLLPAESARDYTVLNLHPLPDAVYRIAVPYIRGFQKTHNDADTIPNGWTPAVFEELEIQWSVNTGDLTRAEAANAPRPALVDLTCAENAAAAQANRFREPYS